MAVYSARVSERGQVTLPKEIREVLNVKGGDQIIFIERDGSVSVENANLAEAFVRMAETVRKRMVKEGLRYEDLLDDIDNVYREVYKGKEAVYGNLIREGKKAASDTED